MQQRAFDNPKVDFMWNTVVTEALGEPETGLTGLRVKSTTDGSEREEPFEGLFLAIGHRPNTEFLGGQITLDESGYIVTDPRSTYTNVSGVFACGDVQDHVYRQAVAAAGSGCMAAIDAERFLESQEG